ncbi:hypothetical protein LC55x_5527 [Lysobacter capsici]|nr:hypothetical protein LC55x_5527 [Lysobacter capsici]
MRALTPALSRETGEGAIGSAHYIRFADACRPFSRPREKVPEGRMRARALTPALSRETGEGAISSAHYIRRADACRSLLPLAGEGARRADEGAGPHIGPLRGAGQQAKLARKIAQRS